MNEIPVMALQGPRSVGKSTLLRSLASAAGREIIDLDDPDTRDNVADDPSLFVKEPRPVFIDEYQRVPALLSAIKAELNRDGSSGQFVITGSTHHDALPRMAEALTGRLYRLTVYPFSQGEIGNHHENLLEKLFSDPASTVTGNQSTTTRDDYIQRIVGGGFPLALKRPPAARSRWYGNYVALALERDVRELAKIRQREVLPRLLERLMSQTAQVLNITKAGQDIGLNSSTAESYTKLLEAVFLVHRLPAWGTTLRTRAAARPKLHAVDPGLAAHLMRLSPDRLQRLDPTSQEQFGHLLETFVVGEIIKQASWMDGIAEIGHWRTHDGVEVDLVVERRDGMVVAFEVKASPASSRHLRGLRTLRDALGDRLIAGVLLHLGKYPSRPDDRLMTIPVDRLWQTVGEKT
ncbi:MAG: ATP-binding protein [bacterium]|nr:ATP-binding protein [bacterium]